MRPAGLLPPRLRPFAWLGFVVTALHAPLAARLLDDASWLLSLCVSAMVGAVLVIDDQTRRAS
jgi:hypothetical protein